MSAAAKHDDDEAEWHSDFPPNAREIWDIVAKALLIRLGEGITTITNEELRRAAKSQAMIQMVPEDDDGFSLDFFIQRDEKSQN